MKVRVKNFQTSKDTTLEVKGFTVVVGKSNTGKTSILRAVEASMFNDSITGCIRYGEKAASVDVEMEGLSYSWEKGEAKNDYTVTTKDGVKEYSKVGFQRPDEIEEAGFREFRMDGEQYPIRPQFAEWHSPIFLLNKTGKVVTELMASVTRLDVINMSIRRCSTNLRRDRSTLRVREDDLKKAKRRSLEFDVLDNLPVGQINTLYQECQDLEEQIREVIDLDNRYTALTKSLEGLAVVDLVHLPDPPPADAAPKIREVESFLLRLESMEAALASMDMLSSVVVPDPVPLEMVASLKEVVAWETQVASLQQRLDKLAQVDSVQIPDLSLKEVQTEISEVERFIASILSVSRDSAAVTKEIEDTEAELREAESRVSVLRGQIQKCPVCGRTDHA